MILLKKIIQDNHIDKNEFITKLKQRAQINQKPIVLVAEDYGVKIPAWRHDLEVLYLDVKEILPKLHQKYKLGIIATQDFGTEKRLAVFDIRQYFDLIIAYN